MAQQPQSHPESHPEGHPRRSHPKSRDADPQPLRSDWQTPPNGTVVIDCDDCAVRGVGCQDCVVSVLLGVPETLMDDERRALEVLADAGMAPRLRLVPVHRLPESGGSTGAA